MRASTFLSLLLISIACVHFVQPQILYNWTVWYGYTNFSKTQLCQVVAPNGIQCQKCKGNLTNMYTGFCQLMMPVDDCYAFDMCWNCQLCHDGFYVNYSSTWINTCVSKKVGCSIYDEAKKICLQCQPGFFMNTSANIHAKLDSQSYCYFIPDSNCISYDATVATTCTKCLDGFQLLNNRCILKFANCNIMSSVNNCAQCLTNYEVDGNGNCRTIARIQNCENQVDYTCQGCVAGYKLENNACFYVIENCKTVAGMICQQCNVGFAVNNQGTCSLIPQIANCLSQIGSTCQKCNDGYNLSNNACNFNIANCLQVSGQVCLKCNTDYILIPNGQCAPKISNCLTQNGLICSKCNDGYNLSNNACIYHIDNCIIVSGKVCTQCSNGFSITVDGLCKVISTTYDPNCKTYDKITYTRCLQCSNGFFLNSKQLCEQVDPLCKTHSVGNGFCLSCYVGYDVNLSTGKCIKSAIVNIVNPGMSNCNTFDFTKNICTKCAQGSNLDEFGKCQQFYDANCKVPSKDLKSCVQCYVGYYFDLTSRKCTIGNFNCATWKDGKCLTCPQGFYMNESGNCVQIDTLCALFNPIVKKCLLCYSGYAFDQNRVCKDINSLPAALKKYYLNCAKYNTNNQCMQCYNGWFIARDTTGPYCQKVSDYCKTYSTLTGKCTSCYLGYSLTTQGQCSKFY